MKNLVVLFVFCVSLNLLALNYSSGDINQPIPDQNHTSHTINVDDDFTVTDVNVWINVNHNYVGELWIRVIHNGTEVTLSQENGGSGNNFTNTYFDDEATTPIGNGSAPFNSNYQPDGNLSEYDGMSAQGNWTIIVRDLFYGETGTLLSWGFDLGTPSGSGTEIDPYQIGTVENLLWISLNNTSWDSYFIQIADIDASSSSTWNAGEGFDPIGDSAVEFSGNFDGAGYTIDGLFINRTTERVGLFGQTNLATITNLGLINVDINGSSKTGALAGFPRYSTISFCYSIGLVHGDWAAGGLIGRGDGCSINNCYSSANVSSSGQRAGGFVGYCDNGTDIENCYSSGDVYTTVSKIGGFVGHNTGASTISNCYSIGSVSGTTTEIGGFCGNQAADSFTYNSFWDTDTSSYTSSASGTGKTTSEMQTQTTYTDAGWDFIFETNNGTDDVWKILDSDYPNLSWQETIPIVEFSSDATDIYENITVNFTDLSHTNPNATSWEWDIDNNGTVDYTTQDCSHQYSTQGVYSVKLIITNSVGTDYELKTDIITVNAAPHQPVGDGTSGNPYQIETLDDLKWASIYEHSWDKNFKQTSDIDASDTQTWNSGEGFYPIGFSESTPFTGDYEGQGYIVENLFINQPSSTNKGLFGSLENATITNLGILNVDVTALNRASALAGIINNSIISNCYSTGSLQGGYACGGLLGLADNSTVNSCYSSAEVSGSGNHVGGFLGRANNNTIINDCYSTGTLIGTYDHIGGFVGKIDENSTVINCYSIGNVTGVNNYGGFAGSVLTGGSAVNCFWNTETSGQSTSAGGSGKTTSEMKTLITYTTTGWDYAYESTNGNDDWWNLTENDNNGYPYHSWRTYPININTTTASSITGNSAVSGGNILGGSNIISRGVCWSTSTNPTLSNFYSDEEPGAGIYSSTLTYLVGTTEYFYRAYATNSLGTIYGNELSFTTTMGGDGSVNDPYQIRTLSDLQWISTHSGSWNSYFIQVTDIDASSTSNWNGGVGFSPIGNDSNTFTGNYDGQDFSIDGLFINRSSTGYVGLFGKISGAEIKNLDIANLNITGWFAAGSLVGNLENSNIESCNVTGVISFEQSSGGLIGTATGSSTITNCSAVCDITGTELNGGLIGTIGDDVIISRCFSSGSIANSGPRAGGLVGRSTGTINNSYSTSNVSGSHTVGGLVGSHYYGSRIRKCYSAGSVIGTINEGGLVGIAYPSTSCSNSLWDYEASGVSYSEKGIGKSTSEMQTASTFTNVGWDFAGETANGTDDYWAINLAENGGYPNLEGISDEIITTIAYSITIITAETGGEIVSGDNISARGVCWSTSPNPTLNDNFTEDGSGSGTFTSQISDLVSSTIYYYRSYYTNSRAIVYGNELILQTPMGGSGTENDPYQIRLLSDLKWLSEAPSAWNSHLKQMADIDANLTQYWNGGEGFSPIGNSTNTFRGSYDGQDYTIGNLFIDRVISASYNVPQGLFGYTNSTAISNLSLPNVNITGNDAVGGLVGLHFNNSSIINCNVTGNVTGNDGVGGLTGWNQSSLISNCTSEVTVNGNDKVGGIAGVNFSSSTIENSNYTGNASGNTKVGGISGANSGYMDNCHSSGTVSGVNYLGGLSGDSDFCIIENCSSSCDVTGTGNYIGGLFGDCYSGIISQCFSTGNISGNEKIGGLIGDFSHDTSISNSYSRASVTGTSYIGGIIGLLDDNASVSYCYSTGPVDGSGSCIGGLIGSKTYNEYVLGSFWDIETSNQANSAGGTGKTTEEMKSIDTYYYAGWDFVGETVNGKEEIWNLYSENDGYPYFSSDFPGSVPPSVTTDNPVSFLYHTATVEGEAISTGGEDVTTKGFCWGTSPEPTLADYFTDEGAGLGYFSSELTGLVEGTQYYYRAYATNSIGTSYSNDYTFTTLNFDIPTVTTADIQSVTNSEAEVGGEVLLSGGYDVTERGICWSTDPNPEISDDYIIEGNGTGSFTLSITGLDPITKYYYRAYAINSLGTGYGSEKAFTTSTSGSGTESDPYQITTLAELRWLSENSYFWESNFIQTADIDAADTQNWNSGEGFIPIGNNYYRFKGKYDGQNYIIDNLFLDRYSDYQGLFGYLREAEISNLGVTNVHIEGYQEVGGLVGYNYSGIIQNCYSTGVVEGYSYIGGLVGYNRETISNSYSDVIVWGYEYVGGFTGYNYETITNCYAIGDADGYGQVGGFVGRNRYSTLTNCYSKGLVSGTTDIGGLIGYNYNSNVNNCFWDTETSGQSTSAAGTGKTTLEMKTQATYTDAGWDFDGETINGADDFWGINGVDNSGYPYLVWQFSASGQLDAPQNVTIQLIVNNIHINWDVVCGASSYKVYSSSDPNLPFENWTLEASGIAGNTWNEPVSRSESKFYFVIASTDAARTVSDKRNIIKTRK